MDTYFTLEEKYIQAVEEVRYGETAKALKLFNDLLEAEPEYARTYFQLGKIYYYDISDYQAAGYYFSRCAELEPNFPDLYPHYLTLLVFLNMEKKAKEVATHALTIPGIHAGNIHEQLGLLAEKNMLFKLALEYYINGLLHSTNKEHSDNIEEAIKRIRNKMQKMEKYTYQLV